MKQPIILGLIGFGAMARQLFTAFEGAPIRWVVLLREDSSTAVPPGVRVVTSLEQLIQAGPRLAIEAAGQQSVVAYVPKLLEAGISVVVASVGALSDEETAQALDNARQSSWPRLIIPSGAIGGMDYLSAVSVLPDTKVKYKLRKPFAAWKAELEALGLSSSTTAVTLFEGSPSEAARLYPKNLNAAFTASLAVRPAEIIVEVIADPDVMTNVHEIEIESAAGIAEFRFMNAPSPDNPKTSTVTALSLAAAVRNFLADGGKA